MKFLLFYLPGVLAILFECDSECVEVQDTFGWISAAPCDPNLETLVETQVSESSLIACGISVSRDKWEFNGITGVALKYCDVIDESVIETFQTDGFLSSESEELLCESGSFIDGIKAKF